MKSLLTRISGVFALTLIAACVNAQTPPVVAQPAVMPDLGTVTGSTYTNNYFGLTLTVPDGWNVQDSDYKQRIVAKGKEIVTSDDPARKSELDRAVDNTLNLVTITERSPGEPGPFNAMFITGAERPPSDVKTDAAYMVALKNTLKYAQVPITIEKDVYTEQIGGAAFSVMDFKTNYPGVTVSQKYFFHIRKDYVLFFIISYDTPEQLKIHTEILRSVVLK